MHLILHSDKLGAKSNERPLIYTHQPVSANRDLVASFSLREAFGYPFMELAHPAGRKRLVPKMEP